jgi:hypothetical protein
MGEEGSPIPYVCPNDKKLNLNKIIFTKEVNHAKI